MVMYFALQTDVVSEWMAQGMLGPPPEAPVKLDSAEAYRKLAEEMRVLAESVQDLSNRAKLIMAAENYDRVAASFDTIERSKARDRAR